jgi:hypothetical protein
MVRALGGGLIRNRLALSTKQIDYGNRSGTAGEGTGESFVNFRRLADVEVADC